MSFQTIADSFSRAELQDKPFWHLYFESALPEKFYKELLATFPPDSLFIPIPHLDAKRPDGTISRKVFELNQENLKHPTFSGINGAWLELTEVLYSRELRRHIFRHLAKGISESLGVSLEEAAEFPAHPRCGLTRDEEGFKIGPHPDHPNKLVTVQFYLTNRWDQQGLGTHFLQSPDTPFVTAAFRPNSGYAFVVDKNSWHSRTSLPTLRGFRHTLSLTYFKQPPEPYAKEKYSTGGYVSSK